MVNANPPPTVAQYGSIEAFDLAMVQAVNALTTAEELAKGGQDVGRLADVNSARDRLVELQAGAAELLAYTEYVEVEREFKLAKRLIAVAAVIAVICVGASGVVAARSTPDSATPPSVPTPSKSTSTATPSN
jgi:hypothetical protein